jgi:hypothetical protein
VLAKAAAVAISVGLVALATLVGLAVGVAAGGGGIAFANLAALALHLAFFGWVAGALALAVASSTGRRALASGVAAAFVVVGFSSTAPSRGRSGNSNARRSSYCESATDHEQVDAGHLPPSSPPWRSRSTVAALGMRQRICVVADPDPGQACAILAGLTVTGEATVRSVRPRRLTAISQVGRRRMPV